MDEVKCRLCAKQSDSLMNIFNNVIDNDINTKIKDCIGVSIEENDGITSTICGQCFFLIKAFSELRRAALQNDRKLKGELEENKSINVEDTEQVKEPLVTINEINKNSCTVVKEISNLVFNEADEINTSPPKETEPAIVSFENQTDFMKELNLVTKSQKRSLKKPKKLRTRFHSSVGRIKAAYPGLRIPTKCFKWHMNPAVIVNNKIVDDWIEMNKKDSSSNASSWTVNRNENNTLSLSLTRIPESLEVLLDEFEKDQMDDDSMISDSKSDSSFSPATSFCETDESNLSSTSEVFDVDSNLIRLRGKRSSNTTEGDLQTKIQKLDYSNVKNKRKPNVTTIKLIEDLQKFNDEDIAKMKKNILDALLSEKGIVLPTNSSETNSVHNISTGSPPEGSSHIVSNNTPEETSDHIQIDGILKEEMKHDNALLMETSHISKTFICQTCNALFDSQRSLNEHKKRHNKNTLRCQKCAESFPIVEAWMKHNLEKHAVVCSAENNGKLHTESNQEQLGNKLQLLIDVPSTSGVYKVAKKSTTKASSFKIDERLKKNQEQNSNKIPAREPMTSEGDNCVVISDDEKEVRKDKENRPDDNASLTLYNLLASNNTHYNASNATNSSIMSQAEAENPPKVKKSGPVLSVSLSEEIICLKNIVKKYKSKRVILPKHPEYVYTQVSDGVVQRFSRGVELTGVTNLLDKSYIPVELVPRFRPSPNSATDMCELSVRYNFNAAQRLKPKNTSYKWDSTDAIDTIQKNIPNLLTADSTSTTVSVITTNPFINKGNELEQKQCIKKSINLNSVKLPVPVIDLINKPSQSQAKSVPNCDKQVEPSNQSVNKPDKPPFVAALLSDGSYQLYSNGKVAISRYNKSLTSSTTVQRSLQSVLRPLPPKNTYPPKRTQQVPNTVTSNLNPSSTVQILNMNPSIVTSIPHPGVPNTIFTTSSNTMQNLNINSNCINTNANMAVINSVINVDSTINGSVTLQNMPITNTAVTTNAVAANALNSIHNLNPPNLLLYHTNEQTNLNLHNFISINIPVSTVSTPTTIIPNVVSQNTIMAPTISTSLPNNTLPTVNIPTQQNIAVSEESVLPATKPLIRIKNLSELMDANTAQTQDRSSLQDLYAQRVSTYVNTFKPNAQNTLDEYLQI